jgi:hypothetical protein
VPAIILNTIKFGPIRNHTMAVQRMLLDPAQTLLVGVTLPEEMAVNEAEEIHRAAKTVLQIPYGATVLNACTDPPLDRATEPLLKKFLADDKARRALDGAVPGGLALLQQTLQTRQIRATMTQHYLAQIKSRLGGDVFCTPLVPGARLDRESIARIAKALDEQIVEDPR